MGFRRIYFNVRWYWNSFIKRECLRVILWKESLNINSDDQQFHRYLQRQQVIEKKPRSTTYGVGVTGPGLGQVQTVCNGIDQNFGN